MTATGSIAHQKSHEWWQSDAEMTHAGPVNQAELTCGLAVSEGGVGKEGSCNRLEGQPDSGLLDHVWLTLKVNIALQQSDDNMYLK